MSLKGNCLCWQKKIEIEIEIELMGNWEISGRSVECTTDYLENGESYLSRIFD